MFYKKKAALLTALMLGITTAWGGECPGFTGGLLEVQADELTETENSGNEEAAESKEALDQTASVSFTHEESIDGYRVVIEAPEGVFPEGTTLQIKKVADQVSLIEKELPDKRTVEQIVTFDISFWKDGAETEPQNGDVKVSITLDSDMKKTLKEDDAKVQVFHIDDDKTVEEVTSNSDGDEVSFKTGSFSEYAVVTSSGILDTTAPVITGLSLSATTVTAPGKIEVTATATDDISGVKDIDITFYNETYKKTYI